MGLLDLVLQILNLKKKYSAYFLKSIFKSQKLMQTNPAYSQSTNNKESVILDATNPIPHIY